MFAGNIGAAQSVDTIIKAAALCKDVKNLRWHIVGDGKELDSMKRLAKELDVPVIFHGRKPMEDMPKYYAMADAMLVTMEKDLDLSLTLPGKVQSYMAAGKPIIGAIDGEAQFIISEANCGYAVPANDYMALANSVRDMCMSLGLDEMGRKSREYYLNKFTKKSVLKQFE